MERYLSNPNVDKTIVNVIQVYEGGTGGTTVKEAQENLDILDKSTIGAPNGLAILPPSGLFGGSIEGGVDDKPMIDGPSFVRTNQTNRFFITNYDIKTGYDISTSMGSIERDNDYLVFKSGPDVGVAKIKVNNLEVELPIYLAIIGMPFIVSPQSGRDDINSKVEIKTSEFVTGEVDTYHAATDWQLSTTVEMDNIFKSVEKDSSQLTSWNLEGLQENVTYYIRFRYWDNVGNKSSWSEITQFKTRVSFAPAAPTVIDPPNGAKEQKADVTFTTTPFSTYEDVTHVSSDWQVSTSSVFAGLVEESEANEVNLESWTIGGLKTSTLYYVRVRHTDSRGRKSDWSLPSRFTTRKSFAADTPKIISPVEAEENHNSSLTIVASHFSNGDSRVTHQSSDWEISEDNSFQYPFLSSYSNSTSKVEWLANKLKPATTYYVRVRYRDTLSFVTDWSKPVSFKTKDSFAPDRPIITSPMNNTEDVGPWLDMRTSAFVSNNQGDEHLNSDWEIGTSLVFKDLVKWNTATIDDKIGWRVKGLEEASQYFVRVRHRAIKDGEEVVSDWSPVVKFNTKPSFAPGRPTITYPKSGSKDINENVTFTSTNYEPSDSQDVHVNSDWEISTNSAFTDIVQSNYGSATAKTTWAVTNLKSLTTFFVRVRHRTINDGIYYLSEWSSANNFTVEHEVPAKPVILTPSNGATRVSTTTTITCSAYVAGEVEEQHFSSSWEISSNSDFNPVVVSVTNSTTNKVIWSPSGLQPTTTYFVRVKHIGSLGFESPWSDASQFTTKAAATSNAPTITSPPYGATNVNTTLTFTSSSFSSTESSDNHTSSDWELAIDSSFSTKVKTSTGSNADRTSWSVSGLTTNTVYYVRVRHNGSESGPSPWSTVVSFTTRAPETIGQVAKPTITSPTSGANNLSVSFTIIASAFSSTASGDNHKASDWEVSRDIGFSNVVKSSYDNVSNKTSWNVGGLDSGASYYLRVRYKGTTGGNSPWSNTVNVSTMGGGGTGKPDTPLINSPLPGASITKDVTFMSSEFSSNTGTHASSDWEIATESSFTNIVKSSYSSTTELTKLDVFNLASGKTYYARVRYTSSEGGSSDWSPYVSFSTTQVPIPGANGSTNLIFPSSNTTPSYRFIFDRGLTSIAYQSRYYVPGDYPINQQYVNIGKIDSSYRVTSVFLNGGDYIYNPYSASGPFSYHANSDTSVYSMFFKRQTRLSGGGADNVTHLETQLAWVSSYMASGGFASGTVNGDISDTENFMMRICFDKNMQSFIFPRNSEICIISNKINEESGTSTTIVTPLNVPPEYTPEQMGQKIVQLSPDGSVAVTVSPFDWVYVFSKSSGSWTFSDRFKLPMATRLCQVSENGDVLVFAGEKTYRVVVYTRKNGLWGANSQSIWPGGRVDEISEYWKQGYCTVSYDGRTISASNGYIDDSSVYIYRLQGDGTYGEVGVINCTPPSGSKISDGNKPIPAIAHQLSADGSKCIYITPSYTLMGNNGVEAILNGEVKVAK